MSAPSQDEGSRLLRLISAVQPSAYADATVEKLTVIDGNPLPLARSRGRSGQAMPYLTAESKQAKATLVAALTAPGRFVLEGNLTVAAIFYRDSLRSVDLDNLFKLVLDAATTAKVWHDDKQVTGLAGVIELDRETPRTVLAIASHSSSLLRS